MTNNRFSFRAWTKVISLALVLSLGMGCSLDKLVRVDDTDQLGVIDRSKIKTYQGAVGMYFASIKSLSVLLDQASELGGLMTDELMYFTTGSGLTQDTDLRLARNAENGLINTSFHSKFHPVRVKASQAREMLMIYGSEKDSAYIANTYAIEGFAIVLLAEFHCSGVPLTEVAVSGAVKYTRGYTTTELFEHAVAKFDSALMYAGDSVEVLTFASVGKGRALLAMGRYDEAADAVKDVPDQSKYDVAYTPVVHSPWYTNVQTQNAYRILDNEGGNGITWAGAGPVNEDPRVKIARNPANSAAYSIPTRQAKYASTGTSSIVIASGVEARLIEAEALLQPASQPQGDWIAKVNQARRTRNDLPDLVAPVTADERIDMVFREKAMWTYLTATRLGEMRRLVRNYDRATTSVFPSGNYSGTGNILFYGNEVLFAVPIEEKEQNNLYSGCIDRNA